MPRGNIVVQQVEKTNDRKKRSYRLITGRPYSSVGTMYDTTPILNPLPPEGSIVEIYERKIIKPTSYWGLTEKKESEHSKYVPSQNYVDVWGKPLKLEVLRYTHGIQNPLDAKNCMVCRWVNDTKGKMPSYTVRTLHIACGYLKAEVVK